MSLCFVNAVTMRLAAFIRHVFWILSCIDARSYCRAADGSPEMIMGRVMAGQSHMDMGADALVSDGGSPSIPVWKRQSTNDLSIGSQPSESSEWRFIPQTAIAAGVLTCTQ